MAVVNHTGAQATDTWDTVADEHHLTGAATAGAGVTITWASGAGANPIRFDGAYTFTFSSTSSLLMTGTSATVRQAYQPNGAATTWATVSSTYIFFNGNTGTITLAYLDIFMSAILYDPGNSTSSMTAIRVYGTGNTSVATRLNPSAGTHTIDGFESWVALDSVYGILVAPTGGTNTLTNLFAYGASGGVNVAATGGTTTITGLKAARCTTGVLLGGSVIVPLTNVACIECGTPITGQTAAAGTNTFTRVFAVGIPGTGGGTISPAAGQVHTFTDSYFLIHGNFTGVTARVTANACVFASPGVRAVSSAVVVAVDTSGVDIVTFGTSNVQGKSGGTSDDDYIAGNRGAFAGAAPASVSEGPLMNWTDSNFALNVDNDSGNTTSTSTPVQYASLTSNRTNPSATPNLPLTVTSIVATPGSNTVNITWTTGIKARSRVLIGTSAGVTRANATSVSPWKYHGILDAELVDFTLPVTSHSHDIALPPGTYYAVPENYDPCGRRFLGAETSFTIAAAGGGAARSMMVGTGGRVS